MGKLKGAFLYIISSMIVIGVAFGIGFFMGRTQNPAAISFSREDDKNFDFKLPGEVERRTLTVDEIKTKLSQIGQLASYSCDYFVTKDADFTRYFIDDIAIPGTTNTIYIECQGLVKVGYDVEDIVPTVDNDSKKIYIALPVAQVLDNYIIWDSVKCSENNTIFNPIDFSQYQSLISEIEKQGLTQAEEQGIYHKAEEHIKVLINNFLSGFAEFEIVFL